ncbi:MAG TPA: hypothetical protein VEY90_02610 [Thermoleophilaceae bacterium]|nr:hypothetical protein [Thermoleophilaceae bacterium]
MMKDTPNAERGNVMVTAILMLSIMLGLGLAVVSQVDTQTTQSRKERERESSFNLAEASLSAQTFILGRRGTGTKGAQYPLEGCPSTSANFFCPDGSRLMASYNGAGQVDFGADTTWRTFVRDDADLAGKQARFWKDQYLSDSTWPRYDADGNRHVWVRSEAKVRGQLRAIVAWVRIEDKIVPFPRYAVLAGWVDGKNDGGHNARALVTSTGSLGVAVRCDRPPQSPRCINLSPTKGPQLQPPSGYELNYTSKTAINSDALLSLEDVARANGTWYATCPANPNGDVVYVKDAGAGCHYGNDTPAAIGASTCCNTQANPGLYIVEKGTVDFGGNIVYWGVVYNVNVNNSPSQYLVETSGTAAIKGGVLVDGDGGVYAGSSGDNIVFFPFAFDDITAVGTAGVVQNTWREIVPPDRG